MKQTAFALWTAAALLAPAHEASALSVGSCYSYAELSRQLAAEKQTLRPSLDSRVAVSFGSQGQETGYVIEAREGSRWCVVSVLERVRTISQQQVAEEVCDTPAKFPEAVTLCNELKAQSLKVRRTISAQSSRPALTEKFPSETSKKPQGAVTVELALCVDRSGREVLCGRTETLLRADPVRPR